MRSTPDDVTLDHGDLQTESRAPRGRCVAGRSAADDHESPGHLLRLPSTPVAGANTAFAPGQVVVVTGTVVVVVVDVLVVVVEVVVVVDVVVVVVVDVGSCVFGTGTLFGQ